MSEKEFLEPVFIDAFDLNDAWFQSLSQILKKGHVYTITKGSYEGQKRLEFDFVVVRTRKPSHQIIPIIPEGMSIPAPTDMEYVQRYLSYLLTGTNAELRNDPFNRAVDKLMISRGKIDLLVQVIREHLL